MELIEQARATLDRNGYVTGLAVERADQFAFEDATVYGFVTTFPTVHALLSNWEGRQDTFFRSHASKMGHVPVKAWNAYAIFLTEELGSNELQRSLMAIEEDFRTARKIARAGVSTREALETALGPLLPLKRVARLEDVDIRARLSQESGIDQGVLKMLQDGASPEEIAAYLLESK